MVNLQKKDLEQIAYQLELLQKDVTAINRKIGYIYGFAAAIGVVSSMAFEYIKSKFLKI